MPLYSEETISPLVLTLDTKNPRFIAPVNPTKEDVRRHLLKHENVDVLIQSIIRFGGIMPGEVPIICEEDGEQVVLEGNRRVCAYQLLLDPRLYPDNWPSQLTAQPVIVDSLNEIPVHRVRSREDADPILTMRHLGGIKEWPTIAKMNYLSTRFLLGKTIDELHNDSGIDKSNIKEMLGDYNLLKQALALPVWTDDHKTGPLDWYAMEVTRFTRVFHTKGTPAAIGLSYDQLYQPVWANLTIANQILELTMRAAFIIRNIDTRTKSILRVPGIADLLRSQETDEHLSITARPSSAHLATQPVSQPQPRPTSPAQPQQTVQATTQPNTGPAAPVQQQTINTERSSRVQATVGFFETITIDKLTNNKLTDQGIINLAREIQYVSRDTHLNQIPNASAMLLRNLLEQVMKRHIANRGSWDDILAVTRNRDPGLQDLINYFQRNLPTLYAGRQERRLFNAIFNNSGIKDSLDLIVHHPHITSATPVLLKGLSRAGLTSFIQSLLDIENPGQT